MKINIFSGARRLAFLVGICGAVIAGIVVFSQDPSIKYNYRIATFGAKPVQSDDCNYMTDALKTLDYSNEDGSSFSVRLCFAASRANNNELLVPFEERDGQLTMNNPFSDDVRNYVDNFSKYFFTLPATQFEAAKKDYLRERIWIKVRGVGYICLGLIGYVFVIGIIGWVMRGFLSIPSGHDFRTDSGAAKN